MADRALGQFVDPAVVVEKVGQIGFAFHQLLAEVAFDEGAGVVHEALARQVLEDVEHLFGVFLILDQLAKVLKRLERTELLRLAIGMGEDGRGHGRSFTNHLMLCK